MFCRALISQALSMQVLLWLLRFLTAHHMSPSHGEHSPWEMLWTWRVREYRKGNEALPAAAGVPRARAGLGNDGILMGFTCDSDGIYCENMLECVFWWKTSVPLPRWKGLLDEPSPKIRSCWHKCSRWLQNACNFVRKSIWKQKFYQASGTTPPQGVVWVRSRDHMWPPDTRRSTKPTSHRPEVPWFSNMCY